MTPENSLTTRMTVRIPQCLVAKRADFSGRTVASPDASLDVCEIGIPAVWASTMSVVNVVTPSTVDWLSGMVRRGLVRIVRDWCKKRVDVVVA